MRNKRSDIRRVEIYDISSFPINDYCIDDCVLLEEIPEESIVYIQDCRKDVDRCLVRLKNKEEIYVYMSFPTLFSFPIKSFDDPESRNQLKELYDKACKIKALITTENNIVTFDYPNYVIDDGIKSVVIEPSDISNMSIFFKDEVEDFIDLLEDMTYVMKIERSVWEGFDSSIREKMEEEHVIKEVGDDIELYHKKYKFTI